MTFGHHAGVGLSVGDDHDRIVRSLDVQSLHLRAHVAKLDAPPVHPNVAVLADRDQQVAGVAIDARHRCRLEDRDAGLLDERRRDDEEDQQIRREVEHRREVDAGVFRFWCMASRLHG